MLTLTVAYFTGISGGAKSPIPGKDSGVYNRSCPMMCARSVTGSKHDVWRILCSHPGFVHCQWTALFSFCGRRACHVFPTKWWRLLRRPRKFANNDYYACMRPPRDVVPSYGHVTFPSKRNLPGHERHLSWLHYFNLDVSQQASEETRRSVKARIVV